MTLSLPLDVCLQIEPSERAQGWNFSAGPGTWQPRGPSLFLLHGLLSLHKQFKGSTGVSRASRSLGTLHRHHPFLPPLFPEGEKRSLGPWEARWGIRRHTARQIHLGRTRRKRTSNGFHMQDLEAHTLSVGVSLFLPTSEELLDSCALQPLLMSQHPRSSS